MHEKERRGWKLAVSLHPNCFAPYPGTGSGGNPASCNIRFFTVIGSFPLLLKPAPSNFSFDTFISKSSTPLSYNSIAVVVVANTFVKLAMSNIVYLVSCTTYATISPSFFVPHRFPFQHHFHTHHSYEKNSTPLLELFSLCQY